MRMSVHKRAMARVVWTGMAALAILTATGAQQTAKHPITFDDLIVMHRIAEAERMRIAHGIPGNFRVADVNTASIRRTARTSSSPATASITFWRSSM